MPDDQGLALPGLGGLELIRNVKALPAGYYERMCETEEDWYIRRFVMNEWGYSRDGLPVYVTLKNVAVAKKLPEFKL